MAPRPSNGRQLLIIVCSCIFVAVPRPSSCQQLDCLEHYQLTYLLSIEQDVTDRLRVTATLESRERYTNSFVNSCNEIIWPESTSWLIPDVSLSPECGPEYFRCRELFVEASEDGCESTVVTVFVPLESGMLLLNMWYDINTCTLDLQTEIVDNFDSSPTVVYKTENRVLTVCISSVNNDIALYEMYMYWNRSLIYDVEFERPLTRESITNLSSSYLSNFVLKLSSQEDKVFFAIDSSIYVMDVLNSSQTKQHPEAVPGCDRVHRFSPLIIISTGEQSLLAYCGDVYAYYDTFYEDWSKIHTYSKQGIPYLCPNRNYKVTFRIFNNTQRSLQFSVTNSNPMIIDNVNLTSGVCFEVGNTIYFVWSDQQQNTVSVFDFATQTHYPVASYECLSTDCPQLLLLANQYIVYDVDYTTYVLNAVTNFSLIFNVSRSDSARVNDTLKTVLNISVPYYYKNNESTTATVNVHTTNSPVNISTTAIPDITDSNLPTTSTVFPTTVNHNNNIIPTVTVIAGTVIIGILVSITVAISVMFLRKRQTR